MSSHLKHLFCLTLESTLISLKCQTHSNLYLMIKYYHILNLPHTPKDIEIKEGMKRGDGRGTSRCPYSFLNKQDLGAFSLSVSNIPVTHNKTWLKENVSNSNIFSVVCTYAQFSICLHSRLFAGIFWRMNVYNSIPALYF